MLEAGALYVKESIDATLELTTAASAMPNVWKESKEGHLPSSQPVTKLRA